MRDEKEAAQAERSSASSLIPHPSSLFFGGLLKMFCPKCGQPQADEVRFCSRCGLPLAGVNELLLRGGQLPTVQSAAMGVERRESPKRQGIRQGGAMILIATFLIPMLAIMSKLIGLPRQAALLGVLLFMGGLLRFLYAAIFQPSAPRQTQAALPAYAPTVAPPLNAAQRDALPPAQGTPVYTYRPPQMHTAEMQTPPSVTEHTTRLLDQQSDDAEQERR
ncbi:MAG TPA: zinc ribbon domain-containing protein [Pyrinomonadaceae bacterium]|nr:zinc ribbon domain-containing protein [Pyrinomonadaceae bacterium]